ncbi:MAG: VapC toxin family PIN domain ribonuclease [Verrucomicrobia bacterium]|nr:VapC toxin family PIN domain ribonuclease [Verrucomicrobiota bacterium]
MIAVDTNILVYAHREDSQFHVEALNAMRGLADGDRRWAIPWPCVHEFISIVTHPGIYQPPSPLDIAVRAMKIWIESSMCVCIGEGAGYFDRLADVAAHGKSVGPMIHDARIAAICLHNGVQELWTLDRDFSRYRGLSAVNPLLRGKAR